MAEEAVPFVCTAPLTVCVDVRHPSVYLALGPVRELAASLGIEVDWLPFEVPPAKAPPAPGTDRGSRHRHQRAAYHEADTRRYAEAQGLVIRAPYRDPPAAPSLLGLLWLQRQAPERRGDYLQQICAGYWREALDIGDVEAIAGVLAGLGEPHDQFRAYASDPGPGELAALRDGLIAAGVFNVPTLLAADETFVGRAHLPMIRWLLTGREGPVPI